MQGQRHEGVLGWCSGHECLVGAAGGSVPCHGSRCSGTAGSSSTTGSSKLQHRTACLVQQQAGGTGVGRRFRGAARTVESPAPVTLQCGGSRRAGDARLAMTGMHGHSIARAGYHCRATSPAALTLNGAVAAGPLAPCGTWQALPHAQQRCFIPWRCRSPEGGAVEGQEGPGGSRKGRWWWRRRRRLQGEWQGQGAGRLLRWLLRQWLGLLASSSPSEPVC